MSKKPITASKYEKHDPNFVSSSSQRTIPQSQIQARSETLKNQMNKNDEANSQNEIPLTFSESSSSSSSEMSITKEEVAAMLRGAITEMFQSMPNIQQKPFAVKPNPTVLTMNNYSFWSKSMKAAMELQEHWLDPTKNASTLSEQEKLMDKRAAQYILTFIDPNNMSQITKINENSFITIWNLLREFHEPQTASTLIDFYASLQSLHYRQGECVRHHLLRLDRQFEKLLEARD
jgi:hypothetical protein